MTAFGICAALVVSANQTALAVDNSTTAEARNLGIVPDPETLGGESASVVQVANLIYAGTKTSEGVSSHSLRA